MGDDVSSRATADDAVVFLGRDGHFEDASPAALDLLGIALDELKGLSPRALMAMGNAESEALSATWKQSVPKVAAGEATVQAPDGRARRLRFLLTSVDAGRYKVLLERTDAPPTPGLVVFTLPEVLAAWRASERRLADVVPGSAEWESLRAEIDAFRRQYQSLFEAKRRRNGR